MEIIDDVEHNLEGIFENVRVSASVKPRGSTKIICLFPDVNLQIRLKADTSGVISLKYEGIDAKYDFENHQGYEIYILEAIRAYNGLFYQQTEQGTEAFGTMKTICQQAKQGIVNHGDALKSVQRRRQT